MVDLAEFVDRAVGRERLPAPLIPGYPERLEGRPIRIDLSRGGVNRDGVPFPDPIVSYFAFPGFYPDLDLPEKVDWVFGSEVHYWRGSRERAWRENRLAGDLRSQPRLWAGEGELILSRLARSADWRDYRWGAALVSYFNDESYRVAMIGNVGCYLIPRARTGYDYSKIAAVGRPLPDRNPRPLSFTTSLPLASLPDHAVIIAAPALPADGESLARIHDLVWATAAADFGSLATTIAKHAHRGRSLRLGRFVEPKKEKPVPLSELLSSQAVAVMRFSKRKP
jgi:hypothetical protein